MLSTLSFFVVVINILTKHKEVLILNTLVFILILGTSENKRVLIRFGYYIARGKKTRL